MVMQINMAVFLVQFAATCFLYREHTALWSTLVLRVSAGVLIAGSPDALSPPGSEDYRAAVCRFKGKQDRAPRFCRTNSRLIRIKK